MTPHRYTKCPTDETIHDNNPTASDQTSWSQRKNIRHLTLGRRQAIIVFNEDSLSDAACKWIGWSLTASD